MRCGIGVAGVALVGCGGDDDPEVERPSVRTLEQAAARQAELQPQVLGSHSRTEAVEQAEQTVAQEAQETVAA